MVNVDADDDRLNHLRLILDTANDAFIGIDESGEVIDWNRRAEEQFGWSRHEAQGRPLADLIIPEEYRQPHRRGLQRFLDTGEGRVLFQRLQMPAVDRDGRRLDVELTIWPSKMSGRWRFNAFIRDVTETIRERRYAQLQAQVTELANAALSPESAVREALHVVCDAMGWPVGHAWVCDRDQPVLRPTGWWHRPERAFDNFVAATDAVRFDEGEGLPGRVAASGAPDWVVDVQTESNFPRRQAASADGLHSAVAFPVLAGDRPVAALEFYTTDEYAVDERTSQLLASLGTQLGRVFERAEANADAEQARRFKGRMLTALAHDLKAPAAAIAGFAGLLDADWDELDDEAGLDFVARIRRQADQIFQLVSELVTVERLDTGAHPHRAQDVDVSEVLRQVVADLVGDGAHVDIPGGLQAHVDPEHLWRMVTNLLSNAQRHGQPPVIVTAASHDATTVITVEDHGPGVPADLTDRLFEPFASTAATSSGLGLSIVRGLAQLNGGHVHHDPAAPAGARFVLTLPAHRPVN